MAISFSGRRRFVFLGILIFLVLLLASSRHEKVQRFLPTSLRGPGSRLAPMDELPPEKGMTGGSLAGPGPEYERFIVAERALPQHNLDNPFPEGKTGKYVKFSEQIKALGWNNVLNEV